MECPSCHKIQDPSEETCESCGIIFSKWFEIKAREMRNQGPRLPAPTPPPPPPPPPAPPPPAKPILEISPDEISAYKIDPLLRTGFGILLTALHPLTLWAHTFLGERVQISPYVTVAVLCTVFGFLIGLLAKKRNYSDILTAGGAGMVAGLLRSGFIYVVTIGTLTVKLRESMPVFAIFSFFTLLGGLFCWAGRTFFGLKLD